MKKAIAILFVSLYVLSTTELNQFFKLPMLFEHYSEHKTQNNTITFMDFLKIHYQGNHAPDSDDSEDRKLPFKSHSNVFTSQIFAILPAFIELQQAIFVDNPKSISTQRSEFIPTLHLESIWQPPKAC